MSVRPPARRTLARHAGARAGATSAKSLSDAMHRGISARARPHCTACARAPHHTACARAPHHLSDAMHRGISARATTPHRLRAHASPHRLRALLPCRPTTRRTRRTRRRTSRRTPTRRPLRRRPRSPRSRSCRPALRKYQSSLKQSKLTFKVSIKALDADDTLSPPPPSSRCR